METWKLVKPSLARRVRWSPLLLVALAGSCALHLVQCAALNDAARSRDVWQQATFRHWKTIDALEGKNADLARRLDGMTATAGAYRAYEVYHDCVQQSLGVYQVPAVKAAYDEFFRSTTASAACLKESAWYETHPVGIDPAHLHR